MRQIGDYCLNAEVMGKRLCAANLLQKQFLLAEEHYSLLENFSSKKGALDCVRNKSLSSYNICSPSVDTISRVATAFYDLKIKFNISVILSFVTEIAVHWFRRGYHQ
jgi:hypothetical protein